MNGDQIVKLNPANRILLAGIMLFSFIYKRSGVDLIQLKAILRMKLTIDDRIATGVFTLGRKNNSKEIKWATIITMVFSLILGTIFLAVFSLSNDLSRLTVYYTVATFMLAMILITDLSSILFNAADNYILLPRPVSSSTFLTARFLHILIHLLKIVIPLTLPAWLYMFFSKGLFSFLVFMLGIVLITLLIFSLVQFLYLLLIRIFTVTKINSVLTTVQIIFSIIFYALYFGINFFLEDVELNHIGLAPSPWLWIFPGYWMANLWLLITQGTVTVTTITGACLSIVFPVIALWITIRYLAPSYLRKIGAIGIASPERLKQTGSIIAAEQSKKSLSTLLAPVVTGNPTERLAFITTWKITSRYKDFRLKVYPGIGYLLIIYAVTIFHDLQWNNLQIDYGANKLKILMGVYLILILYTTAIIRVAYHEQFKASWIWHSAPLSGPGEVIAGAIKATLVKFYLLPLLAVIIVWMFIFGMDILPNLIFGAGSVLLINAIYSWPAMDRLPFSVSPNISAEGKNTFRMMFIFILVPVVAIPHYLLFQMHWLLWILSVISFSISFFIIQTTKKISWSYLDPETE